MVGDGAVLSKTSFHSIPEELMVCIILRLTPPWLTVAKVMSVCKTLKRAARMLVLKKCGDLGMRPLDFESTGSLLNALRHVRYAKAFWSLESRFTLHCGSTWTRSSSSSWLIRLDRVSGVVAARYRSWETGRWVQLSKHGTQKSAGRFIFLDGSTGMLASSTGSWFSIAQRDDGIHLVPVLDTSTDHLAYIKQLGNWGSILM